MKAKTRSISGALMMLVIIPIFAGLLACMPEYVPLGDPERARVDKELAGLWYAPDGEEFVGNIIFMQPWDKRTWLSVNVSFDLLEELDPELYDPAEYDISTYPGLAKIIEEVGFSEDSFEMSVLTYKSWLVRLARESFFTWELRGIPVPEEGGLEPWYWLDFRIDEKDKNRIAMRLLDPDFPPLQEAPKTRTAWEKVVRKHVDEEEMYLEGPVVLVRVKPEHEEMFTRLVFYAMTRENW